ncbi:MAG TPA: hypothetical protein VHM30_03710, partial [Gemmatimonadaceae bacterium]|nr:hypothetical protein [Gemmatimonadaceae bacterium]
IGAIPRLLDLAVPDYLVAATVEGVLAQRLVRRICDGCRTTYTPAVESAALVAGRPTGRVRLQRGAGCAACRGTGYRGRIGLFEVLIMDDRLKDAIVGRASRATLRTLAQDAGMHTIRADGWSKIEAGHTTLEEVLRVVQQ